MLNLSTASRLILTAAEPMATEANNAFVVLLGLGTVFVGLIALIIICKLMGLFFSGTNNVDAPAKSAPVASAPAAQEIPNRQEMVAAISAVLAEELGTDVSAIRIHSIKRV